MTKKTEKKAEKKTEKPKSKFIKMKKGDIVADVHPEMEKDYLSGGYEKVK